MDGSLQDTEYLQIATEQKHMQKEIEKKNQIDALERF